MTEYKSETLEILMDKSQELLTLQWKSCVMNIDKFKHELINFRDIARLYRPKYVLSLLQQFSLVLNQEMQQWIKDHIDTHLLDYGVEKLAYVLGGDFADYIDVIDSLEVDKSGFTIRHFIHEQHAHIWLTQEEAHLNKEYLKQQDLLSSNFDAVKAAKKRYNKLPEQEVESVDSKRAKYEALSEFEKEVLNLFSLGHTRQEISSRLRISESEVRNIRLKIMDNIGATSLYDIIRFAQDFQVQGG